MKSLRKTKPKYLTLLFNDVKNSMRYWIQIAFCCMANRFLKKIICPKKMSQKYGIVVAPINHIHPDSLRKVFEGCGTIESMNFIEENGKKIQCQIFFSTPLAANKAVRDFDGQTFIDRTVTVIRYDEESVLKQTKPVENEKPKALNQNNKLSPTEKISQKRKENLKSEGNENEKHIIELEKNQNLPDQSHEKNSKVEESSDSSSSSSSSYSSSSSSSHSSSSYDSDSRKRRKKKSSRHSHKKNKKRHHRHHHHKHQKDRHHHHKRRH